MILALTMLFAGWMLHRGHTPVEAVSTAVVLVVTVLALSTGALKLRRAVWRVVQDSVSSAER
ncbi:hypothetical protein [Allokutzneria sp. NRRL B-24872]|uniref:hypothetical protein n=1 Tax=Allokutzneria sp. NRRL B-24872 TaxID=1137961 RepID=UPI000A387AA5|nr:hypothetical protein [Allokutzneria sp. NRRL B-24872]